MPSANPPADDIQIGEIVSALNRFAPEALSRIQTLHPNQSRNLGKRGATLGAEDASVGCDVALAMLAEYGAAATGLARKIRRKLGLSW